jgi:hypothetical protein
MTSKALASKDYATAMRWLRQAADTGCSGAMLNLGLFYQLGRGVPIDYGEAMRWYRKAADLGFAAAMNNIGALYQLGQGVSQDYSEAMRWFRKGADLGDRNAMRAIGSFYQDGLGVPQDYSEAMRWYRKAADLGDTYSMNNIGLLYNNGQGVPPDYGEAMGWYRKAADLGNPMAMGNIGRLYEHGQGVPMDYSEARRWLEMAAARGFLPAKMELYKLATAGSPQAPTFLAEVTQPSSAPGCSAVSSLVATANTAFATKDYATAMRWYRQASDAGCSEAMFRIGVLYAEGLGVPQDYAQALAWYRKAADQGQSNAQINLGVLYAEGLGVPQDYARALASFRMAADRGDAKAYFNLSVLYRNGWGVPQDKALAATWIKKIDARGFASAESHLGFMYYAGARAQAVGSLFHFPGPPPPAVTTTPSPTFLDNFTQDASLNTSLWTVNGAAAFHALTNFTANPMATIVTPTLTFSSRGMLMSGIPSTYEQQGVQSVSAFAPPFTVTASVVPTQVNSGVFQFLITTGDGGSGVSIGGGVAGLPIYTGIGYGSPSGPGMHWDVRGQLSPNVPVPGTTYQLTISVDASGLATVSASSSGSILGAGSVQVGGGPFYVVLAQGSGAYSRGPDQAYWQSVQLVP